MERDDLHPATISLMGDVAAIGIANPKVMTQTLIRSLFGTPAMAERIVSYWFRTVDRSLAEPPTLAMALNDPARLLRSKPHERVSRLLDFLATAPADPCFRIHRVGAEGGGDPEMRIFFFPFGVGNYGSDTNSSPTMADELMIPVEALQVRDVRIIQLFIHRHGSMVQIQEDPVFGFFTCSHFVYRHEAQVAMEMCRPVLMASAARACLLDCRRILRYGIRDRTGKTVTGSSYVTSTSDCPSSEHDVIMENRCIHSILQGMASRRDRDSASSRLQRDVIAFVFQEDRYVTGYGGSAANPRINMTTCARAPTDEEIILFASQVRDGWMKARMEELRIPPTRAGTESLANLRRRLAHASA